MKQLRLMMVIAIAGCMNTALAAVFNVQENPNNALDTFPNNPGEPFIVPGELNPPNTVTADIGRNIALGGLGGCIGFGCSDDFDSFRMIVPVGIQINSIDFTVPNVDGTAEQLWIFPAAAGVRQVRNNPDWQVGALLTITDNIFIGSDGGLGPATRNTVLGPGSYDVVAWNFVFIGGGVWQADFYAGAAVPLPASLVLMLGACVAMFRTTRRRVLT